MRLGNYELSLRFTRDAPGHFARFRFTVPDVAAAAPGKPIDLGILTLRRN
jgi:hypothetical protein